MNSADIKRTLKHVGISVVAIGLGIGSGEFILWPYLSYNFGFVLLWGALLGITLQIILNTEIQRYALVTGKTIVEGSYALSKKFGIWFILSTIVGFGWPGFAASSAFLLSTVFGINSSNGVMSVFVLMIAGAILISGKNVYLRIEKLLKIIIPLSFLVILIIFIYYFDITFFKELLAGLVGLNGEKGLIPKDINLSLLLGAIVYAGSGGNLLISQASYILEKPKFSEDYVTNRRFQIFENIFVFGGIGLLTIMMLSYLAKVLTFSVSVVYNDISFLSLQAGVIAVDMGQIFATLYLLSGAFALFAVQLGVLDLLGRVCKELFFLKYGKYSSQIYSLSVAVQVLIGVVILLSGANQPLWLIITGSVFNAVAMGVISLVTLILNINLKKEFRPSLIMQGILILISVFYISFFIITLISGH